MENFCSNMKELKEEIENFKEISGETKSFKKIHSFNLNKERRKIFKFKDRV